MEKRCVWCGEGLGYESTDREPDSCGKQECNRELRAELRAEQEERMERARADDYERY